MEHSNADSKDQEDLQVERNEELYGPQGSGEKFVYTVRLLTMTHRLPVQQGQDYLEGYYVCA